MQLSRGEREQGYNEIGPPGPRAEGSVLGGGRGPRKRRTSRVSQAFGSAAADNRQSAKSSAASLPGAGVLLASKLHTSGTRVVFPGGRELTGSAAGPQRPAVPLASRAWAGCGCSHTTDVASRLPTQLQKGWHSARPTAAPATTPRVRVGLIEQSTRLTGNEFLVRSASTRPAGPHPAGATQGEEI
jgi:hypothetical protein